MSFFDTIVSDLSTALGDPGKFVTDALDAVLPDRLQSISDAAGGVVDLFTGHTSQATALFTDGLKDLPQLINGNSSSSSTPTTADVAVGTAATEPPPPAATASASTASATSSTDSADVSSLLSLSSDQFMQAISSGAIPADVANDPSAMLQIQARMNDIAEMNQLVTSVMSASHQMQMTIAQNIRV